MRLEYIKSWTFITCDSRANNVGFQCGNRATDDESHRGFLGICETERNDV